MPRLVTIDDLYDPNNDWKPLLANIAWLGEAYEAWKAKDTGFGRVIPIDMGDNTKRAPGLHATEINTCVRQAVYSMRGYPRQSGVTDVNMQMRFDLGKLVHALIQDDLEHVCAQTMGSVSFEPEVGIAPSLGGAAAEYGYTSSCDGIFTFCDDYGNVYLRVGLEIKTMSAGEYDKATHPKDQHIQQGTLYQKCLDLPVMWYLYYNKSNSNWMRSTAPWIVPYDKNEWVRLEDRSKQAHEHVRLQTFPDREEGMPCRWCAFAEACNPTILKLNANYKKTPPRRFGK